MRGYKINMGNRAGLRSLEALSIKKSGCSQTFVIQTIINHTIKFHISKILNYSRYLRSFKRVLYIYLYRLIQKLYKFQFASRVYIILQDKHNAGHDTEENAF